VEVAKARDDRARAIWCDLAVKAIGVGSTERSKTPVFFNPHHLIHYSPSCPSAQPGGPLQEAPPISATSSKTAGSSLQTNLLDDL